MEKNNIKKQNLYVNEEEKTLNWEEIQSSFKKTFGNEIYSSWLQKISLEKEFNDYLIVINFLEKDSNETTKMKLLKEMLSNFNKNKILYLKEQLENENIKISKLFDDHIHYNKYGHKIVATSISNYLKKNYEKFD